MQFSFSFIYPATTEKYYHVLSLIKYIFMCLTIIKIRNQEEDAFL